MLYIHVLLILFDRMTISKINNTFVFCNDEQELITYCGGVLQINLVVIIFMG